MVGGGPAGLAIAIAARQMGFHVTVADSAQMPIDKPCGEGLMPDGVAALSRLGISIPSEASYAFRGIRFLSGSMSVDAGFPKGECGFGIRRTVLHAVMAERASKLGIECLWQTPVTGILPDGARLGGTTIRSQWIIGADGPNSRVRNWCGLDAFRRRDRRFAFRQHFRLAPWTDRMELHWGREGEIYVTPVSQDEVCVALISRDPKLRLADALPLFPALHDRLRGVETASSERGAMTSTCRLRRVSRGRFALIGDASGTVDAITGEGLCLAFSQAMVLAECLRSGNLARYESEHRKLALRPLLMARLMLTLDGRPKLQHRTLKVFRQRPRIFQRLLELHVGALSPLHLAMDGLSLGWGLLTT